MKKSLFLLIFLLFISVNLTAQVSQQWIAKYNTGAGSTASAFTIDGSGNVYVIGEAFGIVVFKYNTYGSLFWYRRYGAGTDTPAKIVLDAAGNIYETGYSVGNGTGYDYATVKYDSTGVQQWASRYSGLG